jgi:hypothetical protein
MSPPPHLYFLGGHPEKYNIEELNTFFRRSTSACTRLRVKTFIPDETDHSIDQLTLIAALTSTRQRPDNQKASPRHSDIMSFNNLRVSVCILAAAVFLHVGQASAWSLGIGVSKSVLLIIAPARVSLVQVRMEVHSFSFHICFPSCIP